MCDLAADSLGALPPWSQRLADENCLGPEGPVVQDSAVTGTLFSPNLEDLCRNPHSDLRSWCHPLPFSRIYHDTDGELSPREVQ